VSVVAWRIIQRKFAKRAFRAEGARFFGGRWNSPGHAVVYTAQSLALAALELLVNVDSDKLLQDYVAIPVTVDPQLITKVDKSAPPNNWRAYPASKATRTIGDEWISEGVLPVLQVPSAVIPTEFNFAPNPSHTEFVPTGGDSEADLCPLKNVCRSGDRSGSLRFDSCSLKERSACARTAFGS
jgi:RES domain-containing protein